MKPLRKADVMFKEALAGAVEETGTGYRFTYDAGYLATGTAIGVALKMPSKVVGDILQRFQENKPVMLEGIEHSRLSPQLQDNVRQVIEDRQQRLFGN